MCGRGELNSRHRLCYHARRHRFCQSNHKTQVIWKGRGDLLCYSPTITRYSSMINHLELCEKQNKSHISRSKLRGGIWKLCRTCRWLTKTKIFACGYMKTPLRCKWVFANFPLLNLLSKYCLWCIIMPKIALCFAMFPFCGCFWMKYLHCNYILFSLEGSPCKKREINGFWCNMSQKFLPLFMNMMKFGSSCQSCILLK
jgi:hypothetical protein